MDKTANVIEQVIKSGGIAVIGIGLLFILIALIVGVFKQTWLISRVNTTPKEKLAKMDLDYLTKYFGLFFGIFGGIMMLSPFIFIYLNILKYFSVFFRIAIFGFFTFIILYFNVIKRKRIYNKKDKGQTQAMDVPTKKWRKYMLIVVVAATAADGLFSYLGYKEPKVQIDANAFKLKGLYGVNLSFAEIVAADTISWHEMPAIAMRTNGMSLNRVRRGKFKTTDDEKVHLSIHRGVSPVIRIVAQDGSVYYINRKNAAETRKIFNKLNIN